MPTQGNPNWEKGMSGNPGGRPSISPEVKQAAREYSIEAIETLAGIMRNTESKDCDRIKSSEVLLNRGWGTPTQSVEVSGIDGQPLAPSIVKVVFDDKKPSE